MNKRRTSRLGWGSRLLIAAALLAFPAFGLAVILTQDDDSTTRGAPETRIESGPSDTYRLGSAGFRFSKSEGEASFECRLDRGSFKPCDASPTFHLANGPHELEVRAVDMGGNTDLTPARWIWWADALLANGNFETPARGWREQGFKVPGWKGHEGVVSVVKGGIAGDSAGRLTPSRRGLMSMYSAPFPINSTVAGASYTARGFVRSDRPGRTVCLRLREWVGEKQIGAAHSCRKTSESWAKFRPVRYEIRRDGSELDMYVYQATLTIPRDRFDVDGLSLSDGRPPSVPPVPE